MCISQVGDVERAADTMIGRGSALVMLTLFKIGENLGEAPPWVSQVVPVIVVGRMAPRVDHGIDRTGAAEDLPPGPIQATLLEVRLGHRLVRPIVATLEAGGKRRRHVQGQRAVGRTRFQEEYRGRGLLREPMGEHTPRGARADDDVVIDRVTWHGS
jgi:hypothetical protein